MDFPVIRVHDPEPDVAMIDQYGHELIALGMPECTDENCTRTDHSYLIPETELVAAIEGATRRALHHLRRVPAR